MGCSAAAFCCVCAVAQQNAQLEEVVVTATRVDQALRELPFAVDVIEAEDIQVARPLLGIDEALQGVPGVLVQNRFNYAQDLRISVRGFGARSAFGIRGIRVLIDGIPATLPDGQSGVDGIDTGVAGRIELLRGSVAARYGNAGGGVLLIETARGSEQPTLRLRGAVGSDGYRRQQLAFEGTSGDWNYLASVADLDYTGFRDHAATRNRQASVRLEYTGAEDADWLFTLHHTDQPEAFDPGGINQAQAEADPSSARDANVRFGAGEALEQTRAGLRYRRALSDRSELLWRVYATDRSFDGLLPFGNGGAIDLDRTFYGTGLQWSHRDASGRHQISFGFDLDRQDDERQRFVNDNGVRGAVTLDQTERVDASGAYALWQWSPADQWRVDAALRYDQVDFDVDDQRLIDGDNGGSLRFDAWSPSIGVSWSIDDSTTWYASVSRSFETPTTTELANPSNAGGFNPDLDPQIALQTELGLRWFADRHQVTAALFRIDVDEELIPFELAAFPGRDFFENAGESRRHGLETSWRADWSDNWQSQLSYTFSDYEFRRFVTDGGSDFSGNAVPGIARHQYFAAIRYRDDAGWFGALEATRVSGIVANNAGTVSSSPFTRVELRAARKWVSSEWTLEPYLSISNALDDDYTANVRVNAFGARYFEPGPDRAIFVGFDARMSL